MKTVKIKFFAAAIAAIVTIGSIALVSCDKKSDNFTSKEQLTAPYMDMVYSVDLNTFEVTTISRNEIETFIDFYLDKFSTKAFIAWGISEMSPDSVDVYLIPHASHYANNIKSKFNALQNGAKFVHFHDKDKNKVNTWANEQMEKGYIVVCYYDEKTKEYHALAYTKLEWALLNLK